MEATNVTRTFNPNETPTTAIRGVNLAITSGEMIGICGPSGCGKSTLLHLLGAMDAPTGGAIQLAGTDLAAVDEKQRIELRRTKIGFVFQAFHLLPTLTVLENVTLPLDLQDIAPSVSRGQALELLDRVGMSHRAGHFPSQLSGGEMQRTAIARAVIHRPLLVLADEPTGSLDSVNGEQILDLLCELNCESGQTIVMATHSVTAAERMHRVIHMRDGLIEPHEPSSEVSETTRAST